MLLRVGGVRMSHVLTLSSWEVTMEMDEYIFVRKTKQQITTKSCDSHVIYIIITILFRLLLVIVGRHGDY